MIQKIPIIQNFGVFKDFNWNRDNTLQGFKEKNIIYGWNYSGKTTISRIFSSLRDKQLHIDHSSANFKIKFSDGTELESSNISESTRKLAVFNREYIDSKLSWDSRTQLGEPISFDVGENIEIRNEIEQIEQKIEKVNIRSDKHSPNIKTFNEYEKTKLTEESKNISLIAFGAPRQFDKGRFKHYMNLINNSSQIHIISNNSIIEEQQQKATSSNTYDPKNTFSFTHQFSTLKQDVENLLSKEPPEDTVIDILELNRSLYNWVSQGLKFEENLITCSFCGSNLKTERLEELNRYFSNASKELRNEILSLKAKIERAISSIKSFSGPSSSKEYIDTIQKDIETHLSTIDSLKESYSNSLQELKNELERKEDGHIFSSIEIKKITNPEKILDDWIESINNHVNNHNLFIENFDTERDLAREKLIKHLVSSYLKSESYFEKKKKKEKAETYKSVYDRLIQKLEKSKNEKVASLKTVTKGKAELDKFIKKFLNRNDIEVSVTEDDKFILNRGGKFATNLSEGEKTAIAFSYFMVSLESLGMDEMQKTIVFIDDPISSLDSNHISQVYTLINSFFFRKGIDPENQDKVCNCFSQLFISTHNFDFFSFLKDSSQLKKTKKITNTSTGKKETVPCCEYYYVQKIDTEQSVLKPLPKPLKRFKSEYVYLFEILYNYRKSIQEGEEYYDILVPNAMRRFLEIYTLMKLPNESESLESRISQLVNDVNQFKLLNHFSHFTTFEKATRHDELIMILPDACDELFNLLSKDTKHFDSLVKAIGQ